MGIKSRLEALTWSKKFNESVEVELGFIFKDSLRFDKGEEMLSIIDNYDEMILPKDSIKDFKLD